MRGKRWPAALGVAVGLAVIVVGAVGLLSRHSTSPPAVPLGKSTVAAPALSPVTHPASPSASTGSSSAAVKSSYAPPPGQEQVAKPVWLTIPALNLQKRPVIALGLTDAAQAATPQAHQDELSVGSLDTMPLDNANDYKAGWYDHSARPGAIGPAIIAGHINYSGHQGIFANLPDMRPGEHIYVGRADGTVAEFTVTKKVVTPKTDFPKGGVFAPTTAHELILISCGGGYDSLTHHYYDNVIVYATEVTSP